MYSSRDRTRLKLTLRGKRLGIPLTEIRELLERVTPLRVAAIVVNLAILVYLVYAKRLFGVRGGAAALERQVDWEAILASPVSLRKTPLKT